MKIYEPEDEYCQETKLENLKSGTTRVLTNADECVSKFEDDDGRKAFFPPTGIKSMMKGCSATDKPPSVLMFPTSDCTGSPKYSVPTAGRCNACYSVISDNDAHTGECIFIQLYFTC